MSEGNTPAPEGVATQEQFFSLEPPAPEKPKAAANKARGGDGKAKQGGTQAGKTAANHKPKTYPEGSLVVHQGDHKTLDKEMSEKEIYDLFNEDHPDVSMDRYELIEDKEKKRLWFKAKSFKKGGRPEEDGRPIRVLTRAPADDEDVPAVYRRLGPGGVVYEVRTTYLGTFRAPVPHTPEDEDLSRPYDLFAPKAPARLLADAIDAFRCYPELEAVVEIMYDRRTGQFRLVWPDQRNATGHGVDYDPLPEDEDVFCYLNIHSHNAMPAFFSPRDDAYEDKTGFYGVIGRLEEARPEADFRLSCGQIFLPLGIGDLFDNAAVAEALVKPSRRTTRAVTA